MTATDGQTVMERVQATLGDTEALYAALHLIEDMPRADTPELNMALLVVSAAIDRFVSGGGQSKADRARLAALAEAVVQAARAVESQYRRLMGANEMLELLNLIRVPLRSALEAYDAALAARTPTPGAVGEVG